MLKLVADDLVRRLSEADAVAAVEIEPSARLTSLPDAWIGDEDAREECIRSTGVRRGEDAETLEDGEAARVISATSSSDMRRVTDPAGPAGCTTTSEVVYEMFETDAALGERGPCHTPSSQIPSSSLLPASLSMKNLNARSKPTPLGTQLPLLGVPLLLMTVPPAAVLFVLVFALPEAEAEAPLSPVEAFVDRTILLDPALARVWNRVPVLERVETLAEANAGGTASA